MRPGRNPEDVLPPLLGGIGQVVIVVGTFLPWLRSGQGRRNSYQAGGAVRRLIGTTGLIDHLLALWPLVGLACAASIALYLTGLRTVSALLAGVSSLSAGAAAVGALATTATSYAEVSLIGPVATLVGATLVALAVLQRALAIVAAVPRSPR